MIWTALVLVETSVAYYRDGDRYAVFASKAAAPANPDWYPTSRPTGTSASRSGPPRRGHADEAAGEERDGLYAAQADVSTQFAQYQSKTDR